MFERAVTQLHHIGIPVIVHTILCLPDETKQMMLDTISYLNRLPIQGIKLQLLHILKHTDLAKYYEQSPFWLPSLEEYLELLGVLISHLRPDIVVHRLTGCLLYTSSQVFPIHTHNQQYLCCTQSGTVLDTTPPVV